MAVSDAVWVADSDTTFRESRPPIAVRTRAPTDPSAPASVGVATPAKMLPRTTRMRTSGGTSAVATRRASAPPRSARSSAASAGAACGRRHATTPT